MVLVDNLDSLNHGIHDEDGGEGLEGVVGVVDFHVGHEDGTICLGEVSWGPKTFLLFTKNIFLDSCEDEHKLHRGLSL